MASRTLTNDEVLRYSRQIILPEIGVRGQLSLRDSSVLIVGCGGLGCPSAIYLCAAGIGTLGLLDHDLVDLTNLHRQVLHRESLVGQPKCESVRLSCQQLNSAVRYKLHHLAINSSNTLDIISQYDVVLDCTDNVATRYLLSDACVLTGKPLVSGAALKFEGQLTVYNYQGGPCYRCLYPVPPPPDMVTSCSEAGVLGVVPGIIGTMQAQETIKILTKQQGVLSERLFLYDALSFTTRVIRLRPKQDSCGVCGPQPSITSLIDYNEFCAAPAHDGKRTIQIEGISRITASHYKSEYMERPTEHLLVDTRPSHELDICQLPNTVNIQLPDLLKKSEAEILLLTSSPGVPIVFVCHHGNDSQIACDFIKKTSKDSLKAVDIIGGLEAWAKTVDQNFPRY